MRRTITMVSVLGTTLICSISMTYHVYSFCRFRLHVCFSMLKNIMKRGQIGHKHRKIIVSKLRGKGNKTCICISMVIMLTSTRLYSVAVFWQSYLHLGVAASAH